MASSTDLGWLVSRDAIDDHLPNPRGNALATQSIILGVIAAVFVLLRLVTRYFRSHSLGIDDVFIVVSATLAICLIVTYNGEVNNGFGYHTKQVDQEHRIAAFKWFFAAQLLYKIATCCTKLSLATMYLRIFPGRIFRMAVYTVMAITVAYTFAACMVTIFSCRPIEKAWNKSLYGVCLDSRTIWYATSILVILTDAMIIVLPINEIRRLNLPLVKKALLCCLFGLGVFVIACTIIRMVTVSPKTTAADQIYYQATSNSWTFVETDVGIICACLPTLHLPLPKQFRRILGLARRSNTGSSNPMPGNAQSYNLETIGRKSQPRSRVSEIDREADSVEELIVGGGRGIYVTRGYGTEEEQGEKRLR